MRESETWWDQAKCLSYDPVIFMPHAQMSKLNQGHPDARRALAICKFCPVRSECLEEAITNGHGDMIWAGLVPREITRLRRARKIA